MQSIPICFMGTVDYSNSTYNVFNVNQRQVVDTHNVVFDKHSASHPPDDCVSNTPATLLYAPSLHDNTWPTS